MMSSSSSSQPEFEPLIPVNSFSYRNVGTQDSSSNGPGSTSTQYAQQHAPGPTKQEIEQMLSAARADAMAEMQKRMQAEADARVAEESAKSQHAIQAFADEQKNYFSLVESEVVQLALAIAARILYREAQVDPMLVAGLVRVALEKLQSGSNVTIRVAPDEAPRWQQYLAGLNNGLNMTVIADPQLSTKDCVLETELGSADFSIDAQLKEVEQGFCDLIALRPGSR